MNGLGRAYNQLLLESKVSENKINFAIDKHKLVVIRYNTHGEWVAIADRLCGVFAYGMTKAGNPCIRVFEYQGDTTTFVPGWKLIRLDRIISWHETKRTFSGIPGNPTIGEFNPDGDNSMSIVYKVAQFNGQPVPLPQDNTPKTSNVVKTGTPSKAQQQKRQDDAQKAQDGLKPYQQGTQETPTNEPKTAQDGKGKERVGLDTKYANKPTMKTDTERAIDYLRRQLNEPEKIDVSKYAKFPKQAQEPQQTKEPQEKERVGIGTQYADKPTMKTDTENALEYLRKQLENPKKIDLSKLPKK